MRRKYFWIIQANKKHPLSMQEARISINRTRLLVCLHPWDWHHRRPNTKPILFACLKHRQWCLSKHLLFLIKILFPLHKNYIYFFHLMKLRMEIVWDQGGTLCIFYYQPLTLAEINVEWSHWLNCILTGQMSPSTSALISSATEWSEMGETERSDAFVITR